MKKIIFTVLTILISLPVHAQMFSMDSGTQDRNLNFSSYFRFGAVIADFEYTGDIVDPLFVPLSFNNPGLHLGVESSGFELNLKMANKLTGLEDLNYLDVDLSYSSLIPISFNPNRVIGIPFVINSALINIGSTNQTREDFSQFVLSINGGLITAFRFNDAVEFNTQGTYGFGFSSSSGGLFGGNSNRIKLEARLNFLKLFKRKAVSFGYNYEKRSFNIDGEILDYDLSGHSATLGISF